MVEFRNAEGEWRLTPAKIARKASRAVRSHWWALYFGVLSRFSRSPLTSDDTNAAVNLTSYGDRIKHVHKMLESVARGTLRPKRVILWIDAEEIEFAKSLKSIQRFIARGLEVRAGHSEYRVHNKYYNFVLSGDDELLLTADDDVFYPQHWFEELWLAFEEGERSQIVGFWVSQPKIINGEVARFSRWEKVTDVEAKVGRFTFGVSGVIFPESIKKIIRSEGEAFLEKSPIQDDIWLSRCALVGRLAIRQVKSHADSLLTIPRTQGRQLAKENVLENRNDLQIRSSYTRSELDLLVKLFSKWNSG